ncbi:MAG: glycosyltransferase family protein [Saprospiraceae bacterium]
MNPVRFIQDILAFPANDYDFIISDFEPISAWAGKIKKVPVIALSNQAILLEKYIPKPKTRDFLALAILKYYSPSNVKLGYSYIKFNEQVFSPMIRNELRNSVISDQGHYTVYLPSYSDEKIIDFLSKFKNTKWQLFSKNAAFDYKTANIEIFKIDKEKFTTSIVNCTGIVCNAGFETTSEALFLGKKMMAIPQKNQYEQQCNTHLLNLLGVHSIDKIDNKKYDIFRYWIESDQKIQLEFPDMPYNIVERILSLELEYSTKLSKSIIQTELI